MVPCKLIGHLKTKQASYANKGEKISQRILR